MQLAKRVSPEFLRVHGSRQAKTGTMPPVRQPGHLANPFAHLDRRSVNRSLTGHHQIRLTNTRSESGELGEQVEPRFDDGVSERREAKPEPPRSPRARPCREVLAARDLFRKDLGEPFQAPLRGPRLRGMNALLRPIHTGRAPHTEERITDIHRHH